jgi:hypothetical protein
MILLVECCCGGVYYGLALCVLVGRDDGSAAKPDVVLQGSMRLM